MAAHTKAAQIAYSLFLDDERDPPSGTPPFGDEWVVVRSSDEARAVVEARGMPAFVSFDHDLGDGPSGLAVAHWLIERDLDGIRLPRCFTFRVHSMNPVGAANIEALLRRYLEVRAAEDS